MRITAEAAPATGGRSLWQTLTMPIVLAPAGALHIVVGGALFTVSFVIYLATLTPGLSHTTISGLDGPELVTMSATLKLLHSPGYPLYGWLGYLFTRLPIGEAAYELNLFSALTASLAAVVLYAIVILLTGRRLAAFFAAILFSLAVDFWFQAVLAEVYAPNTLMVGLTLFLFLYWEGRLRAHGDRLSPLRAAWPLLAGCFVFGLSLGTHLSNVALIPALGAFVLLVRERRRFPLRALFGGAALFLLAACQFAWLPLKASTLNDKLLLEHVPNGPVGVFDYMFNVFHSCDLRFPYFLPTNMDAKLVAYGDILLHNFGPWGIALAVMGMLYLCRRRRTAFWLLAIAYVTEVLYFTIWNYNAYDLKTFLVPSHLIFAAFIGCGVCSVFDAARRFSWHSGWLRPAPLVLAALLALPIMLYHYPTGWAANDRSEDTTIDDFYRNVYSRLPEGASLYGNPGVVGFDMFYYQMVDNIRPDVTMPQLRDPFAPVSMPSHGNRVFSTVSKSIDGEHGVMEIPEDAWLVPVLSAPAPHDTWWSDIPLNLYEVRSEPPALIMQQASPQYVVGADMDGVTLLGFDLPQTEVKAGGTVHLRLYWQPVKEPALNYYRVATIIGDQEFQEVHSLSFGVIGQYQKRGLYKSGIIVEDYDLVILSSLPEGPQPLRLRTFDFGPLGSRTEQSLDLAMLEVTH